MRIRRLSETLKVSIWSNEYKSTYRSLKRESGQMSIRQPTGPLIIQSGKMTIRRPMSPLKRQTGEMRIRRHTSPFKRQSGKMSIRYTLPVYLSPIPLL
jgi:hypothetical protein